MLKRSGKQISVLSVVGARPNFMKIAPLMHAMQLDGRFTSVLVHTGQHYDDNLSAIFFRELNIKSPDFHLGIGSYPREEQIERIESAFEPVLLKIKPDYVLVVGDVNSTVAAARMAKKHGIRVVHVEAGLRSFDLRMPEELNRIATDQMSDYLFVTEPAGMTNLQMEGVGGKHFLVGNVMIDSLRRCLDHLSESPAAGAVNAPADGYVVVTIHRPSNVDSAESLQSTLNLIRSIAQRTAVVFPLHPRTASMLERHGLMAQLQSMDGVALTPPLGYRDFVALVSGCRAVVTDSGGVQEEATYMGIPCITMRQNTERPITAEVGTNVLVGSDPARLITALDQALAGTFTRGAIPELWDGKAAPRIIAHLWEESNAQ